MPILIRLEFEGWSALTSKSGALTREGRVILREAHRQMGLAWHTRYIRHHFSSYAPAKYGYQRRKQKYLGRKKRLAEKRPDLVKEGGTMSLVYSGLTRDKVMLQPEVRGFPSRATVRMHAPSYASIRPRGNRPDLREEINALTDGEQAALAKLLGSHLEEGLNTIRARATVTVA